MPCSQDDCPQDALWQPVLELRPKKSAAPPSRLIFEHLGYCEEHKSQTTVDTVLSDEALVKISKFMRESGWEVPDRSMTTLAWDPLGEKQLQILSEHQDHTQSDDSIGSQTLAF